MAGDDGWDAYLAVFHAQRPGITEAVLGRARSEGGRDPDDWLLGALIHALPDHGVVAESPAVATLPAPLGRVVTASRMTPLAGQSIWSG